MLIAAKVSALALIAGPAQAATLLTDGGFEAPMLGAGGYTYSPVGSAWTFSGSALVSGAGSSAWYGGSAPAGMGGEQFAALQATSSISQTFTTPGGTLYLSWLSAGRPNYGCCNGDQNYEVLIDGIAAGSTFSTASGKNFSFNTLDLTGVLAGDHTLTFEGLIAADETAFLDNVVLSTTPIAAPPGPPVVSVLAGMGPAPGEQVIENFDDPIAAGFSFDQTGGSYVRSGALGLNPGQSAPPPGDLTNYETVTGGYTATLTSSRLLDSVSFYMGSPDSYNWVRFLGPDYDWTLGGDALFNPQTAFGGDQSIGRELNYSFGDALVNQVIFGSDGNSFEFDTISAHVGAVPEPSTWVMLFAGAFGLGQALRMHRRASGRRPAL
jgi:hypothetical protein